jgi:hypothetical protein
MTVDRQAAENNPWKPRSGKPSWQRARHRRQAAAAGEMRGELRQIKCPVMTYQSSPQFLWIKLCKSRTQFR